MISDIRIITTRKGQQMANVILEDLTGSIQVTVFSKIYPKMKGLLLSGNIITVKGRVEANSRQEDSETVSLIADFVTSLRDAKTVPSLDIHLEMNYNQVDNLLVLMDHYPGEHDLVIHIGNIILRPNKKVSMEVNRQWQKIHNLLS